MATDGFYAGYFTGEAGNGLAMFTLLNGVIVGIGAFDVRVDHTPTLRRACPAQLDGPIKSLNVSNAAAIALYALAANAR
jgi:hypothetical protein